jgi:predicted lipoprotein
MAAFGAGAHAQSDVAAPYYNSSHEMAALYRYHYAPRGQALVERTAALGGALQTLCAGPASAAALEAARKGWRDSMAAWEGLSAVQIGPLIGRRSARSIDFQPPRPALITRAVQAAPADAAAMERVGAPAKGFPALEWLLWTQPVAPQTAECRYAQALAADLNREAQALAQEFTALAAKEWESEEATTAFSEFVNQWTGGIDRFRWAAVEKPVRSAGGKQIEWPRRASGSTALAWSAQWQALQALSRGPVLPIGEGLIPLEPYLRGHGLNPLADQLAAQVKTVDEGVQRLGQAAAPAGTAAPLEAAKRLAGLKAFIDKQVAPALEVTIGFSDADGD